jgi:hypothetical protein
MAARRLAITRQHLAGQRPQADLCGIMHVMHDIRYLQLDPMKVVAPSHLLVLWSRLGQYDPSHLDNLLWKERQLLEDWAQATSIVLTEDYPLFSALKRTFAKADSPWAHKIQNWMKKNEDLRAHIVNELKHKGPLLSTQIEDKSVEDWRSTGWTAGRNVDMMLAFLQAQGKVMVAGRKGSRKLWDRTGHFLPKWTSREQLSDQEVTRRAAQNSLRALGVASAKHMRQHYIRRCYYNLDNVLDELETEGRIVKLEIQERGKVLPGPWYVHVDDLHLLDSLEDGDWEPRTTLLSPFDNLISDRQRTEQLFNFQYRFEVYVPKPKRKYGCYVMPILHGDRFIGRIDPVMDRKHKQMIINAVYAEPGAPKSVDTIQEIANAIRDLGTFLGASKIQYDSRIAACWKDLPT